MWTRRDVVVCAVAAAGAFALTVGIFLPRVAGAVNEAAVTRDVEVPTLEVGDIQVWAKLSVDKSRTVLLSARNSSSEAVTAHFKAAAMVTGKANPVSRSGPPASVAWSEGYTAKLKPGEVRQIAVTLPAAAFGGRSYLTLSTDDGKESIQAVVLKK